MTHHPYTSYLHPKFTFVVILFFVLFAPSGCTQEQQAATLSIKRFTVTPTTTAPDLPLTFTWEVAGTTPLTCTLDVEGDGTPDYTVADCGASSGQTHRYSTVGSYKAVLTVTDSSSASATASATTVVTSSPPSPPPSPSVTVTIVAAGDIACDPASPDFNGGLGTADRCRQQYVADVVEKVKPDAVLTLGDHQYEENTLEQFNASYDLSWGRLKPITHPVVGNHEYLTKDAAGYYSYFGQAAGDPSKGYYSYDLGAWHIVALNSSCKQVGGCEAASAQGQWLKADLAAHPTACTLAYWHHPRFSSGHHGSNTDYVDFWEMLQQAGAELVLVGHDHNYERFAAQDASGKADPERGLRQFVVGTGGKGVRPFEVIQPNSEVRNSDAYGALKLVLQPSSYTWEFMAESGSSFTDSGTQTCH
jgi:acid phosphatase type 7